MGPFVIEGVYLKIRQKWLVDLASVLMLLLCGALLIVGIGNALLPLLVAALLAYLLFPAVRKLEEKGVRRTQAIALALVVFLGLMAVLGAFLLPILLADFRLLLTAFPGLLESALHRAESIALQFGYVLPLEKSAVLEFVKTQLTTISGDTLKSVGLIFSRAFTSLLGVLLALLNLLLIPIFFLYLVADYERLASGAKGLIPPAFRPYMDSLAHRSNEILRAYFRGQLLVSLMLGFLYGFGFWLAGLRFGFVIGFLTGLLNLVPIAGPMIGIGLATAVTLADFSGYGTLLGAWGVFICVQAMESFVITPRVVGDRVGLNALESMLVLIAGGNLGGFAGMLVAIPLGGILKQVLRDCKNSYQNSELFLS